VPRGLPTRRERQRPRQGVPLVRTPRTLPRILEPGQVDALLGALRSYRDRAMAEAMVLGGLRRCEVLGLRLADLQVTARRVLIAEGKGGFVRENGYRMLVASGSTSPARLAPVFVRCPVSPKVASVRLRLRVILRVSCLA
jgi:integrase